MPVLAGSSRSGRLLISAASSPLNLRRLLRSQSSSCSSSPPSVHRNIKVRDTPQAFSTASVHVPSRPRTSRHFARRCKLGTRPLQADGTSTVHMSVLQPSVRQCLWAWLSFLMTRSTRPNGKRRGPLTTAITRTHCKTSRTFAALPRPHLSSPTSSRRSQRGLYQCKLFRRPGSPSTSTPSLLQKRSFFGGFWWSRGGVGRGWVLFRRASRTTTTTG